MSCARWPGQGVTQSTQTNTVANHAPHQLLLVPPPPERPHNQLAGATHTDQEYTGEVPCFITSHAIGINYHDMHACMQSV